LDSRGGAGVKENENKKMEGILHERDG